MLLIGGAEKRDIDDEEELLRRIVRPDYIRPDRKLSSAIYKTRDGYPEQNLSVYIGTLVTPSDVTTAFPEHGVAGIFAHVPRSQQLDVVHRPSGVDKYPKLDAAHAEFEGQNDEGKCVVMARRSRTIVMHPQSHP